MGWKYVANQQLEDAHKFFSQRHKDHKEKLYITNLFDLLRVLCASVRERGLLGCGFAALCSSCPSVSYANGW